MSQKPQPPKLQRIGTRKEIGQAVLADLEYGPMACECDHKKHELGACWRVAVRIDSVFICPRCWSHAPILKLHGLGREQVRNNIRQQVAAAGRLVKSISKRIE